MDKMMKKHIPFLMALSFISAHSLEAAAPTETPAVVKSEESTTEPSKKEKKGKGKAKHHKKDHAKAHSKNAKNEDKAAGHTAAADAEADAQKHSGSGAPTVPAASATTH